MTSPQFDLSSKTAVVIGATSRIGLGIAKGPARAGANMLATGRRADLVKSVTKEIEKNGRRTLVHACGASDSSSLESLPAAVSAEFDGVQILSIFTATKKRTPTLNVSDAE